MREFRFRAWDEGNKIMHHDFQFFTSVDAGNDWICFSSDKEPRDLLSFPAGIAFSNPYFRQQIKIMQSTGLLDKNGKPIYEGDVVRTPNNDWGVVQYEPPFFGVTVSATDVAHYRRDWMESCEVIGNVHENPELLP